METTKLTVRLPQAEVRFAKEYAREHGITVTALINRYFTHLQALGPHEIHPEVKRFAGLVPEDVDALDLHRAHVRGKHR